MKRALVHPDRCRGCRPCVAEGECPKGAFFREVPEEKPWVDFYRCSGCLKCKPACLHAAIEEIAQPCTGTGRVGW